MKRRWWIVLGSAGFAVIALLVVLSMFFGDPINRENCDKIKPGMTEADVEKILGPPSETTDMSRFNVNLAMPSTAEPIVCMVKSEQTWKGRSATISVCFVEGGIVAFARFEQKEQTFFRKIRTWVGLDPLPEWEVSHCLKPASGSVALPD